MRLIAAFFRLVRLPNLFFIALTQVLFQFAIYEKLYPGSVTVPEHLHFLWLVLASLFIAAAGYIINDYFDINIDEINKPRRMVVGRIISRRWAIAWHFMLSAAGVLLTALAVPFLQKWYLVLANMGVVALLWLYSTNFKKQLLVGNIVIALLTAWTLLIVFFSKVTVADAFGLGAHHHDKFFRLAALYASFAFIATLIREAIKDMEDLPGDEKYGCRTMPVVWGVNSTKVYVAVWLIVLLSLLIGVQVYIMQFQWWAAVVYCFALLFVPVLLIFYQLFRARSVAQFHRLSTWIKLVMLAGILSMVFFYFYL